MVVVTCDFIFSLYWQIVKEREIEQLFFFFFTAFAFRGIAKPTTFTHHLDSYSV